MFTNIRIALRQLAKSPGFTVVAVLTLAIGLGANTAIFSAVYSILLHPLPFPDSGQLVSVRAVVKRDSWERRAFSEPDFRDYRAQSTQSFAGFARFGSASFNVTGDGEAARLTGERVSHDYFGVLGVQAALGRTFTAEEDSQPNMKSPVVVLSHDLWRLRYASSVSVLGQRIKLSEVDYTVIGVMPSSFRGVTDGAQLWVPTATIAVAQWNNRGARGVEVVARLKPNVALEQARAELAAVGLRLATAYPETNTNYSADVAPFRDELFGDLRQPLLVLFGAVGLVLLITCANVTNLLLVRLATRRREVAIRASLGASRGALARLFLSESLLVALAGGSLGLLLATWFVAGLTRWTPISLPHFVTLEIQRPAFLFAFAATLLCALAIGALPALLAGRTDLNAALKDAGRSGSTSSAGTRIRGGIVVAEIALSLALLVGSSLFVRSFFNLITQAPGYRTEKVTLQRVYVPQQRYNQAALKEFAHTLLAQAAALPGVRSAALASDTPLDGGGNAVFYTIEGGTPNASENEGRAYTHTVTPDFFTTAGIALLQGETFTPSYATNSEPVAIVSESLARRFWPKGDAVGKRFKPGKSNVDAPWLRIIGVVNETKFRGLVANPTRDPDIFFAYDQRPTVIFSLMVHTAGNLQRLGLTLRQLVTTLDSNIPVFDQTTIEERVGRASASQRFSAQLMGAFAFVALVLAAIGLYGVISFSVSQRTQEIGVRMALGAKPEDILRLVLVSTGRLVVIGLVAGTALAVASTRFIDTLLFAVDSQNPLTYVAVAATLALVALVATWLPARRAAKVDPVTALRAE